jgi:hypothetical protein
MQLQQQHFIQMDNILQDNHQIIKLLFTKQKEEILEEIEQKSLQIIDVQVLLVE